MMYWWHKQFRKNWSDELDFVGPRVRTSVMGWALLALGIVAAMHAADISEQSAVAMADAESAIRRLERISRQKDVRDQAIKMGHQKVQESAPMLDANGWRHAAQLALWLGYPWSETLSRVDETASQSHAVLTQLGLDLSPLGGSEEAQADLKLQAAVLGDAAALQWMQALGPEASLRSRDRLSLPFSTANGNYEWRVDVVVNRRQP